MIREVALVFALAAVPIAQTSAQDPGTQLRKALFAGHTAQATALARTKIATNAADASGVTPLMIAAALGDVQSVKMLLAAGAAVEAKTKADGISALILAADFGHFEVAKALVDGGASVAGTDKQDYSAIDYAAIANTGDSKDDRDRAVAVIQYLQSKGAAFKKGPSAAGAAGNVGGALGNLLAIGGQADLKKLIDSARDAAK
jgi:ankyrin repeat protein